MNTEKYTSLLANPQKIKKEDMDDLSIVLEKFPFFQSARALQLKALKNDNSYLYNDALKVTAAHTTDRNILFEYITSESFFQHEISQAILQHDVAANDIEVVLEDVSASVSLELDAQMKVELKKAEAILNPELFERKKAVLEEMLPDVVSKEIPKKEETPEKVLALDKPLEFKKTDTHSFSQWLQLSKAAPVERTEDVAQKAIQGKDISEATNTTQQSEQQKKFELIESFIQKGGKVRPRASSEESFSKKTPQINLAEPFTTASDTLMTETLAKVYVQQKNYKKAIQAYKILILKNPEKSGFFADQIRAIEKLTNKEKK